MRGPIAGPTAQSQRERYACTVVGSGRISAANDSPLGPPLRISATRLEDICSRLTKKDWEVLNFVSASRLASGRQLVAGLYLADRDRDPGRARVARKHLKRLASWRVIDAVGGRAIGGVRGGSDTLIYGVGPTGVRLLARRGFQQKRLGAPGSRYVRHTLACTQVVVDLRLADAGGVLELIEAKQEPACWRSFVGAFGPVILKPDLYLRVALPRGATEYRAMIEVDLATESSSTIRRKAERHLAYYRTGQEVRDHSVHPRIVWTAPNPRRAQQLQAVLGRLRPRTLFTVCLLSEFVPLLIREAGS
jgi:hypothetical protein